MKKFITLFPQTKNIHLTKDVGMIPYVIGCSNIYESKLITYDNDDYSYLKKEVYGLKIEYLKKITGNEFLDSLFYIWTNALDIDVLHLFHWGRKTYFRTLAYKLKNKNGKTYIKLDMDEKGIDILKSNKRAYKYLGKIIKISDVVSVESRQMQNELQNMYNEKILYFPNGFKRFSKGKILYEEKKDEILFVGRVGTEQKASYELIEAFLKFWLEHKKWKLVLVGSVEAQFQLWLQNLFQIEPRLQNNIVLKGEITDKVQLEKYYRKAKFFVLPSRWESFGLVLVEAMSMGCSLLTTQQVVSAPDIINENCVLIKDSSAKSILLGLENLIINKGYSKEIMEKNICDSTKSFEWGKLIKQLEKYLEMY